MAGRKMRAFMAVGLAAMLLFAGCGQTVESVVSEVDMSQAVSSQASASLPADSSQPEPVEVKQSYVPEPEEIPTPPQDAEAWRVLAYQTVVENLEAEGMPVSSVSIYKPKDKDYVLCIAYQSDVTVGDRLRFWQLADSGAILHFDGSGYLYGSGVSDSTGLPIAQILVEDESADYRYVQYDRGNGTLLYEELNYIVYLPDGQTMNHNEFSAYESALGFKISSMVQKVSLGISNELYPGSGLSDAMGCQILYDYLFGADWLTVPDNSPEWLYPYISAIASRSVYAYNAQWDFAYSEENITLRILEPLELGGPPVLDMGIRSYCFTDAGMWELFSAMEMTWFYQKDEAGRSVLSIVSGNYRDYYAFDLSGQEYLFTANCSDSRYPGEHIYAYCDGEYQEFGDEWNDETAALANGWYDEHVARSFAIRGYQGVLHQAETLGEYELPPMGDWAAFEAALIDVLYNWHLENS